MTLRAPLALAAIVAVTALAGCGGSGGDTAPAPADTSAAASGGGLREFMRDIGAELNEYWAANWGEGWTPATVKVPEDAAATECGTIDAAESGPAYCGSDSTMVLPVAFFRDRIIGADDQGRNDAAVAAVVGHEFGHHLQSIGGLEASISEEQAKNPEIANLLSVANELHADCLMGIWMKSVGDADRLEEGDLDEILTALEAIGDDKLSADAGVEADAATFDHGTSEQRQVWFGVGYETQDVEACNKVLDDLADGTLADEVQAGADAANGTATN